MIKVGDQIQVDPVLIGLMEVLITWRNYTLHYDIDNSIRDESWATLLASREKISVEFNGLDIEQLRDTWTTNRDFTFKETASLIKATQLFVEAVDQYAIQHLDVAEYVKEAILEYFKDDKYFQRFKSAANKREYLYDAAQRLTGVQNLEFLDPAYIQWLEQHRKMAEVKGRI